MDEVVRSGGRVGCWVVQQAGQRWQVQRRRRQGPGGPWLIATVGPRRRIGRPCTEWRMHAMVIMMRRCRRLWWQGGGRIMIGAHTGGRMAGHRWPWLRGQAVAMVMVVSVVGIVRARLQRHHIAIPCGGVMMLVRRGIVRKQELRHALVRRGRGRGRRRRVRDGDRRGQRAATRILRHPIGCRHRGTEIRRLQGQRRRRVAIRGSVHREIAGGGGGLRVVGR